MTISYWYLVFVFCVCLLVFSMSCCCVIMRIVSADNRVLTGSMSVVGAPAEKCIFHFSGFKRHCIQLFKCFTYPWAWLKTQWSTLTPEDPYSSSNSKLATSLSLIWNFVFEVVFISFFILILIRDLTLLLHKCRTFVPEPQCPTSW